ISEQAGRLVVDRLVHLLAQRGGPIDLGNGQISIRAVPDQALQLTRARIALEQVLPARAVENEQVGAREAPQFVADPLHSVAPDRRDAPDAREVSEIVVEAIVVVREEDETPALRQYEEAREVDDGDS